MRRLFSNIIISIFVVVIVLFLILPLPTQLMDVLIIINISLSIVILLITMNIADALEFSIFPSLLLVTTLFRLGLNVSSTRLILSNGGNAGSVIKAFGQLITRGNIVIGIIIFLIIVLMQFIVITKGAERVAEVAARFTLDAMPGKQMAIDADLSSGLINEQQARARREKVQRQADFYGAMDGATKIGVLFKILVPVVQPSIVTASIFAFYWSWQEFLGPLIYLNKPKKYTVSIALKMFADPSVQTNWSGLFAMTTLSIIPVVAVFMFFQKYLVEGVATTGLKA